MASTLTNLLYHLVFSTKGRIPELLALLEKHGIEYDELYLWDRRAPGPDSALSGRGSLGAPFPGLTPRRWGSASPAPGFTIKSLRDFDGGSHSKVSQNQSLQRTADAALEA